MAHVDGPCDICGEPGDRHQIKPRGGRLTPAQLPKGRHWIFLCPKHLYEMHGFFPNAMDGGESERRERRAQLRKRAQRTIP